MTMQVSLGSTLKERQTLMPDLLAHDSGFSPRPIQKLATKRLPRSTLNLECNHFLRSSTLESAHGHSTLPYQLWLEAGKHDAPYPEKADDQYNSNIWRNFRQAYGVVTTTDRMKINDMIATMYPLNIPSPSKVGNYTYAKFIRETPLIKDPRMKKRALQKTEQQLLEFRQLRLKSDSRNPPMDENGAILPPKSFRKYEQRPLPPPTDATTPRVPPPPPETRVDIFGKRVPKLNHTPYMWKLSYRINNPSYKHVQDGINNRGTAPQEHPQIFTHIK